jgi:hyperosmotically inducible protein
MRTNLFSLTLAGLVAVVPVAAQQADPAAPRAGTTEQRSATRTVSDGWITMKIHSQFVPEDALEGSDIDVDTRNGVVTLTGTVPSAAAKARAVALAKATDGVKNVTDQTRIGAPRSATGEAAREAGRDTAAATREAGRDTAAATREAGRDTAAATREAGRDTAAAAREAGRDTAAATRKAGRTVNDGWIKSKIYSQYLTENALDDSDIDIDVASGVVTLSGTVKSQAGHDRAVAVAKATDGVKSVKDALKVSPTAR